VAQALLQRWDGWIGVEMLRLLTGLSREQARIVKAAWLLERGRRARDALHRLEWRGPGAVWAMDFTCLHERHELGGRLVLVVRDLSSRATLEARLVRSRGEQAEAVLPVLTELFAAHGAPLVLKSDLGAGFVAGETQARLARAGIAWLPSPARTPSYNGAVECDMGRLEALGRAQRDLRDRGSHVGQVDLDAARHLLNALPRERIVGAPSRREAFEDRPGIAERARWDFLVLRETLLAEVRERRRGTRQGRSGWYALQRTATIAALARKGYLVIRGG